MHSDDLNYDLPPERIATHPAEPRDDAKVMVIERKKQRIRHAQIRDLPELRLFRRGDLLVLNQTRVLPAYFAGRRQTTGGRVTGLYLGGDQESWTVLLESRGSLTPGEAIALGDAGCLVLAEKLGGGRWRVRTQSPLNGLKLLHAIGSTPLPPYIRRARRAAAEQEIQPQDLDRYNTVYAQQEGSLAAPTAGLHFTSELLARLDAIGVARAALTLHVGIGTFAPIRTDTLEAHQMHSESIHIPAATIRALQATRDAGGRIIAVGTTSVRAIESLPQNLAAIDGDYADQTSLFIYPGSGHRFRFTDALLTNFHLPRSTLLALVAALPNVGIQTLKDWYGLAIEHDYRFYSYGDAMLLF